MKRSLTIAATLAACAIAAAAAVPGPTSRPAPGPTFWEWQQAPALGWNSWDCYGAGVSEEQTLANADYMAKNLLPHGYTLITVDIQWYEPLAHGTNYRRDAALEMDEHGRLLPAANRFPLTKETRSFKPLADKLHAMGLKFGVHLLRGIPRQAVKQNVPILGAEKLQDGGVHAADIANIKDMCSWNTDMYGVDMTKPGAQEYYDSVLALLASWEIDFVKVDDLSSPYHKPEIEALRKAIDKTHRPITFSTSPGATPVNQGEHIEMNANQWRVSNDFWDQWRLLKEQFARLDAWTPYRGPGHFPDADMLPVGNIRAFQTSDTWTHFTEDEQVTMLTLWCISRSPLIIGGNMPKNDDFTLKLLTNDEVLAVDQNSTNNRQLWHKGDYYAWTADVPNSLSKYVAVFNAPDAPPGRGRRGGAAATASAPAPAPASAPATATASTIEVDLADLDPGMMHAIAIRDLWNHKDLKVQNKISVELLPHQAAIYRVDFGKI